MRKSASEILRNLENRVARLERKAARYGKVITGAISILKRKFPSASESLIEREVVSQVHNLYENMHEIIHVMDDDQYREEFADLFPALVRAGLLGEEQWKHNSNRELKGDREINLFAEEYVDASDLAEYSEDSIKDALRK